MTPGGDGYAVAQGLGEVHEPSAVAIQVAAPSGRAAAPVGVASKRFFESITYDVSRLLLDTCQTRFTRAGTLGFSVFVAPPAEYLGPHRRF